MIFAIFLPCESTLRADDRSVPYFPICQGSLPWQLWQPNNVAKTLSTPTDTSCIHCTDARKRIAISWSIAQRSKSTNDASISCENFVKFGRVTSELTVLICERQVRHSQKNWRISSDISWYTGPIFAIFSPYESALCTDDGSVPYFPLCQGTLPWQPNNFAVIKANLYYMHSLHVR